MKKKQSATAARQQILQCIVLIRSQKVILSHDLAALYEVPTKVLMQAVKRNERRFPTDFMFRLSPREFRILRSQIVTSSSWGGRRTAPFAFTEQGVAMLSSVLHSRRAIAVNIEIMRAFVRLRRMVVEYAELGRRIDALEERTDGQFHIVFDAIRALMAPQAQPKRRIGYLSAAPEPS
ncbi:MAG TPA: ORF6N domain-containing protein [Thermoanaerobaculia bacterium]|nr:ORF6N domain-containing protein [Thermoanaerobaculia bacterium]